MVYQQRKSTRTARRSTTLRALSPEYSGVRLRELLSEYKIAPMDFAVFLKISPQRLNNWFVRGVPQSRLDEIARLLSVNANWLEKGVGAKFLAATEWQRLR